MKKLSNLVLTTPGPSQLITIQGRESKTSKCKKKTKKYCNIKGTTVYNNFNNLFIKRYKRQTNKNKPVHITNNRM